MRRILLGMLALWLFHSATGQISTVEYGKNRVQYKTFKWRYYQTRNFNVYFNGGGLELAKYAAQTAESDLRGIEEFVEYGLQRRANIVVYNSFDDMRQSNIGMGIDWQSTGGVTKLVNNKLVVYFNGDHHDLRRQIREGIARILTETILFGEDIGEVASNQALLDLPKWLTDGYISYAAQNWSADLDDQLKSAMLSGNYKNFYQFAFDQPLLAGHAFWYFIEEVYKRENVSYMLYLSRVYKSLNSASLKITKKKFKPLLADFMSFQQEKYYKDIRQRRNVPKGVISISEDVSRTDYFNFQANPAARSRTYAVVQYKKGVNRVLLYNDDGSVKELLKYGIRSFEHERNPHYPIMAWDPKGTRLAILYAKEGKINFFVYDLVARIKREQRVFEDFQQVQDMKYMLDANTILFSAVKNGHTDIFVHKLNSNTTDQITDDVYDNRDASFVAFPNKSGIIYSSNRPSPYAVSADTVLPHNRYNIFLIDNWNKSEFKQISMLSDLMYGNARFPTQYNTSHFTFVSDENGVANRYAGFFTTKREGFDTLYFVGDEVLRNPEDKELDSTLRVWRVNKPDSIGLVSISLDSAYTFPLTNYQSGLKETRIAGDAGMVSEVTQQGDLKFLYKLRVDENTLKRRNVNARPTEYRKRQMQMDKIAKGEAKVYSDKKSDTSAPVKDDFFLNEFKDERRDTSQLGKVFETEDHPLDESLLSKARIFDYKLKFGTDYLVSGLNNTVLVNRYQPFGGGSGPIFLGNGNNLNWTFRVGTAELFEDIKFTGGARFGTDLKDNDYLFSFDYLKKRFDFGFTYYRSTIRDFQIDQFSFLPNKLFSNLYQANISYPFDETKRVAAVVGFRHDRVAFKAFSPNSLKMPDTTTNFGLMRLEYVYDNSINPAQNITNGLKYKVFLDWNTKVSRVGSEGGKYFLNAGFDGRYYFPIYRNFIFATRVAADFSWGSQRVIYYLGGTENWLLPKFTNTPIDRTQPYAFQTLAVNMRGFRQNVANGNNAMVINNELRLPVFSTLFNRPINNAFLRNFQVVSFLDLGTAWNGGIENIKRPRTIFFDNSNPNNPVSVQMKAGGIGPLVGGYGSGIRSNLLSYFLRLDAGWPMNGFFQGKPIWYFSMGFDF